MSVYTIGSIAAWWPAVVPKAAIVRGYRYRDTRVSASVCRGLCGACSVPGCHTGWPSGADIDPMTIKVLRLRGTEHGWVYGWYIDVTTKARGYTYRNHLIKVPRAIARELHDRLASDPLLCRSSLVTKYAETWHDEADFTETAVGRFLRYRTKVLASPVAREVLPAPHLGVCKRQCVAPPPTPEPALTCIICFEDKRTARSRCRAPECHAPVCHECHAEARGLCALCDRSAINADYPCSSCHKLTRLQQYGHACIGCGAHSLCESCYVGFGQCAPCDVMSS